MQQLFYAKMNFPLFSNIRKPSIDFGELQKYQNPTLLCGFGIEINQYFADLNINYYIEFQI